MMSISKRFSSTQGLWNFAAEDDQQIHHVAKQNFGILAQKKYTALPVHGVLRSFRGGTVT